MPVYLLLWRFARHHSFNIIPQTFFHVALKLGSDAVNKNNRSAIESECGSAFAVRRDPLCDFVADYILVEPVNVQIQPTRKLCKLSARIAGAGPFAALKI